MNVGKKIPLIAAGIVLSAFGTGSLLIASNIVYGKRQTPEEAFRWQSEHYDTSWYRDLDKTDYTVRSYDGYELHVQLCRPADLRGGNAGGGAGRKKYVILSHGYTDNRFGTLKYMKMYLDAGYDCIIYDLRGHGVNEKTFCTFSIREAKDLYALICDTKERYGQDISLGLHGESLGASTVIASLQYEQDLSFAVADCGFAEITNVLKVGLKKANVPVWLLRFVSAAAKLRFGYSFREMRPIDALAENHVPLLFIHGAQDHFIIPENSIRMQKETSGYSELYLIPEAGHAASALKNPELYQEYLTHFLNSLA